MESNTVNIQESNLGAPADREPDAEMQGDGQHGDAVLDGGQAEHVTIANEHLMIGAETMLRDCGSVSQSFFGNFVGDDFFESDVPEENRSQIVLLRSNEVIELYRVINS